MIQASNCTQGEAGVTYFSIKCLKLCQLGLTVLLTTYCLSVYGNTNPNSQLWNGESAGYTQHDVSAKDDVAFLIHLGRVQAAIGRANSYDKEDDMKNPFTPDILSGYASIDPFVNGKSSSNLSMQPLLSQVAAVEAFTSIMNNTPTERMQRNEIHKQMKTLILRADAIVTERFPSTRASALAMSALLREAGELLRTGLSANGQIINVANYRDALQLIEASLRLRVNKVSACERSRKAIKQLKSRGPIGDLLDKLIIVSQAGTVNGNAGDVFNAARKLAQLGTNLPKDDNQVCQ